MQIRVLFRSERSVKSVERLPSAGNLEVGTTNFENIEARQDLISKLSRGDLLKPSDVVHNMYSCVRILPIDKE